MQVLVQAVLEMGFATRGRPHEDPVVPGIKQYVVPAEIDASWLHVNFSLHATLS